MEKGELKHKKSKSTGFSIPSNYFDTVEGSILDHLDSNTPQAGFTMPEEYLELIDQTIVDKLKERPKKTISLQTLIRKRLIPIAIAASLALFLYFNYSSHTTSFDNISSTEIEQWIDDDLIELETSQIAEVFDDDYSDNQNETSESLNGTEIDY